MMRKSTINEIARAISREEMRKIGGGRELSSIGDEDGDACPSGQFTCTCNGTNYGCVSSINECWNKC